MGLSISAKSYKLQLKYPFTTSRYTVTEQETVIVSITDGTHTGYGEATANPYYLSTVEKILKSVESVRLFIENQKSIHPKETWKELEQILTQDYFALCAIDCALWDLYGKQNNIRLHDIWASDFNPEIISSYTIGINTIDNMKTKILDNPWPIYKIKLGTPNDLEIVVEIRKITNSKIRIDANCAWSVKETIENSKVLKELDVEYIEQPLAADQWEESREVQSASSLPIIADESCRVLSDVERCAECFDGINIKLMKCGGLTPALKMIEKARGLNLKIMAGCMTESSVGISNLVQISSQLDYLDADGALLLKNDIATGAKVTSNSIEFSPNYGSGIKML